MVPRRCRIPSSDLGSANNNTFTIADIKIMFINAIKIARGPMVGERGFFQHFTIPIIPFDTFFLRHFKQICVFSVILKVKNSLFNRAEDPNRKKRKENHFDEMFGRIFRVGIGGNPWMTSNPGDLTSDQ